MQVRKGSVIDIQGEETGSVIPGPLKMASLVGTKLSPLYTFTIHISTEAVFVISFYDSPK